jgi:hypothetical protein
MDGGLNAISKNHLFGDMMRGRFFRSVLLFIVSCVWVLFCFDVLTSITADQGYSSTSPEQAFLLCMLAMAIVPFGFVSARLAARAARLSSARSISARASLSLSSSDSGDARRVFGLLFNRR